MGTGLKQKINSDIFHKTLLRTLASIRNLVLHAIPRAVLLFLLKTDYFRVSMLFQKKLKLKGKFSDKLRQKLLRFHVLVHIFTTSRMELYYHQKVYVRARRFD